MNYVKSIALTFIASFFLFSACQNEPLAPTDAALSYIPKNAVAVTGVNLDRLMQKADFEEVKKMNFYQNMIAEAEEKSPAMAAAFEDPDKSGIDMSGKIFMTTTSQTEKLEDMTSHIFIPLADASDFEKILDENEVEYATENGRKVSRPDKNVQATWDEKMLVFSFGGKDVDLTTTVDAILNLEKENTLLENRDFRKSMSAEHDLVSFFSTNTFADMSQSKVALEFANLDKDLLRDNYIAGYGDFENGRMVGHADFLVSSAFGRGLVGRFFKKEVETDFSKAVPKGDLAFFTTAALDLRGIDQWLSERPQQRKQVDVVVKDFGGLSRADMLKTLNGDIFLAGFSADYRDKENFIVGFGVKSKKAGKAFLDQAVTQKNLKEIEPGFYKVLGFGGEDFSIRVNKGIAHLLVLDDIFVVAKEREILEEIRSGQTNEKALDGLENQTIAGWLDLNGMVNQNAESKMFESMRFNVNGKGADFIMNTNDPTTNSLKSTIQMLESQYNKRVNKNKEEEGKESIEM